MTMHDDDGFEDMPVKPFHEWLAKHRRGEASEEWAERLAEVLHAVRAHGKNGSLTIKIDIEAKGRTVLVVDTITAKIPEADRECAIFYVDGAGNLVRDDPGQHVLAFPERNAPQVDPETGEIKP
jgi:hypothetical protein